MFDILLLFVTIYDRFRSWPNVFFLLSSHFFSFSSTFFKLLYSTYHSVVLINKPLLPFSRSRHFPYFAISSDFVCLFVSLTHRLSNGRVTFSFLQLEPIVVFLVGKMPLTLYHRILTFFFLLCQQCFHLLRWVFHCLSFQPNSFFCPSPKYLFSLQNGFHHLANGLENRGKSSTEFIVDFRFLWFRTKINTL